MNCVEFESAVESAVEERQPLAEHVFEHASACAQCRTRLSLEYQLDLAIESWRSNEQPSEGFVDRILAELSQPVWNDDSDLDDILATHDASQLELASPTLPSNPKMETAVAPEAIEKAVRRSHQMALSSVVACLLLVAVTMSFLSNVQHGTFNGLLTFHRMQPLTHDELAMLDVSDTIAEVFSDLKSGYREMASETSVAAREIVEAIPDMAAPPLPAADDLDLLPDSSDMKRLWRPIGSRVSTALGFLWQTVPSEIPAG
ncbi:hypothetical protein [Schlesneria paludicola]|uniref:hypothetical protein n=1 Tax=Schlesneria paludicola TaxID=360056 RepID=UPI00029AEBCF|nr:hypothetical protein [Schlesneria paludicola]